MEPILYIIANGNRIVPVTVFYKNLTLLSFSERSKLNFWVSEIGVRFSTTCPLPLWVYDYSSEKYGK